MKLPETFEEATARRRYLAKTYALRHVVVDEKTGAMVGPHSDEYNAIAKIHESLPHATV